MAIFITLAIGLLLLLNCNLSDGGLIINMCDIVADCGDSRLIQTCYFDQSWRKKGASADSICHQVSSPANGAVDDNRTLKRKRLWRLLSNADYQDRQLAKICFRNPSDEENRHQCHLLTTPDLAGLSSRDAIRAEYYQVAQREWNTAEMCFYSRDSWIAQPDHYCHLPVPDDEDIPDVAYWKEQRIWAQAQLVKRDEQDRNLTAHCFYYHQWDWHVPCQGLTFDREKAANILKSDLRVKRVTTLLADHYQAVIATAANEDERKVFACFYSNTWLTDIDSRCWAITHTVDPTDHELVLHQLYLQVKAQARVADCFHNHRWQRLIRQCYLVSWKKESDGQMELPLDDQLKQYWQQLVEADK